MKKYQKKIMLLIIFLLGLIITPETAKAVEYAGSGIGFPTPSGKQCNQTGDQICFYNNTTGNGHITLKATLYYFKPGQNLSSARPYGFLTYSNVGDLVSKYSNVLEYPHKGTFGTLSNSTVESFFTDVKTFTTLFTRATGTPASTEQDVINWMKTECKNAYGYTDLAKCTGGIGSTQGFRIVIEPVVSYQDKNHQLEFETLKSSMSHNIWNQASTLATLANILYLDEKDLIFPAVGAMSTSISKSSAISTIGSMSSSYGFNIMAWPVNIAGICPAPAGLECSAQYYNVDGCCTCEEAAASPYKNQNYLKKKFPTLPSCTVKTTNGCKYNLNKNIPTTCSSGTSGTINDDIDNNCLYKSNASSNDSTVRNQYFIASNSYCAIYCKEQVQSNFPGSSGTTLAGSYFELASSSGEKRIGPIRYYGTKTCTVTGQQNTDTDIKVAQFQKEFKSANDAVIKAWDNWQYKELQKEVADNAVAHHWSATCHTVWCVECCGNTCLENDPITNRCTKRCSKKNDQCTVHRSGTYYTYNNKTYSGNTYSKGTGLSNGKCKCNSGSHSCSSSCDSKISIDTSAARNAYRNAVAARNNLLGQIRQCSDYVNLYTEFYPLVNFTYSDPTYGHDAGTIKLDVNPFGQRVSGLNSLSLNNTSTNGSRNREFTSKVDASNGNPDGSDSNPKHSSYSYGGYSMSLNPGSTSTIFFWDCGYGVTKKKCTSSGYATYPTNKRWTSVSTRNYEYTLPDGMYEYIDKKTGWSYKKWSGQTENYTRIGFSNLPIHYSTEPGKYNFNVYTTTYGNNDVYSKYVLSTQAYNGKSYYSTSNGNYKCTYNVRNDPTILCTKGSKDPKCPHDTDIIYRPISLYYPFPGINGTSTRLRQPGTNWDSSSVTAYIYNNRSNTASYYNVYKLQPMYEVTLTPGLMMKIKKYNEEQNDDDDSYSDFTLKCHSGSGGSKNRKCTSQIIRDWQVRGCAISKDKNGRYTNCGTTESW